MSDYASNRQSGSPTRFEFGQQERLTVRLRGLIRNYPRGVNLIKEFVQNADDAGATWVNVYLDSQVYSGELLPDPRMAAVLGPAILIANDSEFSPSDFESLRKIGESNKVHSGPKIGRFGFGFNTCYNVTDYPSLVTGSKAICLDPHRAIVADKAGEPGYGWELGSLWESGRDWIKTFQTGGLQSNSSELAGTIFRLPLRTEEQAIHSEICNQPFPEEDFHKIVDQLRDAGSELLLFSKHLLHLSVFATTTAGSKLLLRIATKNESEVANARRPIGQSISGDPSSLIDEWKRESASLPNACYRHLFQIETGGESMTTSWYISTGIFPGRSGALLEAVSKMCDIGEKALPWAGVAVKLSTKIADLAPDTVRGRLYCGFPLPQEIPLPVHVNGYFDIDSSRQGIFEDTTGVGGTSARLAWNRALMQEGVAAAYVNILDRVRQEFGHTDPRAYYALLPTLERQTSELTKLLSKSVYAGVADRASIRVRAEETHDWVRSKRAFQLPVIWRESLQEPLCAEGFKIVDPPLPAHVAAGYKGADAAVLDLTPQTLRTHLRKDRDVVCKVEDAPNACIKQRPWIEEILKFCLSDGKNNLAGLPLALCSDGLLHTFAKQSIFRGTDDQHAIFAPYRHWFIDPSFDHNCNLPEAPEEGFQSMQLYHVIANLGKVLRHLTNKTEIPFDPASEKLPNIKWLTAFYSYVGSQPPGALRQHFPELMKFAIIPDRNNLVHLPNVSSTPLLPPKELAATPKLFAAVEQLRLPLVYGEGPLSDLIRSVCDKHGSFFARTMSGQSLIDCLHSHATQLEPTKYDPSTYDQLISFISEERFVSSYGENELTKLKSLRLFPTESGELIALSNVNAFIPAGFSHPHFSPVRLLKLGPDRKWVSLFKKLGVPELSATTFIENEILPKYASLTPKEQFLILDWLRRNLSTILSRLQDRKSSDLASALRNKVAQASLIRCVDGKLRATSEIYDPRAKAVKEILGADAPLPDEAIYSKELSSWLEFFASLQMSSRPRATDIIRRIDSLTGMRLDNSEKLRSIFDYLSKNWEQYSGEQAMSVGSVGKLSEALKSRAWMSALRQPRRTDAFPGFTAPPNRLYRPDELYSPDAIHLVGSQAPVLLAPEDLNRQLRDALGIKREPPLELVLQHFERVIAIWNSSQHGAFPTRAFEAATRAVYSYIGAAAEEPSNQILASTLKRRFGETTCIWDPATEKFWLPRHVFAVPVPALHPYRVHVFSADKEITQALDLLGRRNHPQVADLCRLLGDIKLEFGNDELPEETQRQVLSILYDISRHPKNDLPIEITVLTQKCSLASSGSLFFDDAARWRNRFTLESERLVDSRVPVLIIEHTRVRSLLTSIHETLVEAPELSTDKQLYDACARVNDTIHSPQFHTGLMRLVRHHHGLSVDPDMSWLSTTHIKPTKQIKTDLWLQDGNDNILLGTGDANSYWDNSSSILYVNGANREDVALHLARAINGQLNEFAIADLAPLERILTKRPLDIAETLDRYDISGFEAQDASVEQLDEELPPEEDETSGVEDEDYDTAVVEGEPTTADIESESELSPDQEEGDGTHVRPLPRETVSSAPAHPRSPGTQHREPFGSGVKGGGVASQAKPGVGAESRPPVSPGQGSGAQIHEKHSQRRGRLVSYVFLKDDESNDDAEEGLSAEEKLAIGHAAVEAVLSYETAHQRVGKRMPHTNEGYDIESLDSNGKIRYIEVKGRRGSWNEYGVGLTSAQFEFGRQNREEFWLYVVEFALEDEPLVYPIQNPVDSINNYRFDGGWKHVANRENEEIRAGMGVRFQDAEFGSVSGKVSAVLQHGELREIRITLADGQEILRIANPSMEFFEMESL